MTGLDALGYEEHLDYDIAQSTNPEFGNAIVRVNVFRDHRQTVQYIAPEDAHGESSFSFYSPSYFFVLSLRQYTLLRESDRPLVLVSHIRSPSIPR